MGTPKILNLETCIHKVHSTDFHPFGKSAIKNYSPGIWKYLWTWALDISSVWESLVTNKIK
jgi:hypothetical protein